MPRSIAPLLATLLLASAALAQDVVPRSVAAPPSDLENGRLRLPDPAATPTRSRAALVPLAFARTAGSWVAELELPFETDGACTLALLSPGAGELQLSVRAPGAAGFVALPGALGATQRIEDAGLELAGWLVSTTQIPALAAGTWRVRVESPAGRAPSEAGLVARGAGESELCAWLSTQELVSDAPVGIAARLAGGAVLDDARVLVQGEGRSVELALLDDGEHEDGARGDGVFGALVPGGWEGDLRARVEVHAHTARGANLVRSLQLSFPVLARRTLLDGRVEVGRTAPQRARIALGALALAPAAQLHVSAELWGTDAHGARVPVCWLSRMLEPQAQDGAWQLALGLDTRWIELARAGEPFELRAVRVQDPDSQVLFDRAAALAIPAGALPSGLSGGTDAITPEMLTGSPFVALAAFPAGPHAAHPPQIWNPALMLVHGYCSSGSIWPAADFAQPKLEFLDPNANRTHNQFAQLIAQRAANAGLGSFGVVTHSQGGCASLHLFTYYTSPLDFATGGRRMQTLAAPYQGTPLASLGFFACGVNNDMTPAGSATWLAGIPTWARQEVWYWTTSNSGSVCNSITHLFLSSPEDGTVEQARGQLPGANNMGHTTGWCHTTGMSNPASYTDHARNQAMNANAAR